MRKTMSTLLAVSLLGVGLIGCGNSTNTPAASKDSNSTKATSTAEATSTTNAESTSKEDAKKDFDNKELSIAVFQGDMAPIIGMKLSVNSRVLIQG